MSTILHNYIRVGTQITSYVRLSLGATRNSRMEDNGIDDDNDELNPRGIDL